MARFALAALCVALFAAAALAQPCIECKDCRSDNCFRNCKNSCNGIQPNQVIVNGDACKRTGRSYANSAAREACETTKKYCNGGRTVGGPQVRGVGPVTLAQCANIANGACQGDANNAWNWGNPCSNQLRNGHNACNAQQFRSFFEGETKWSCTNWAKTVTGVNPGTNQWAGQQGQGGGGWNNGGQYNNNNGQYNNNNGGYYNNGQYNSQPNQQYNGQNGQWVNGQWRPGSIAGNIAGNIVGGVVGSVLGH